MKNNTAKWAWYCVYYLVVVILWGAVVRMTGSGAGCGAHWPKCNGEVIPIDPSIETIIEFGHRLTSGLSLLFVIGVVFLVFKTFEKGHSVRKAALFSLFFILIEAAIGAVIVLFEWVAQDTSVYRAFMSAFHLVNTFLLLGAMVVTARLASFEKPFEVEWSPKYRDRQQFYFVTFLLFVVAGLGAVTALGDTLFPVESFKEGLAEDFNKDSHFLVRLRVFHPMTAIFTGVLMMMLARNIDKHRYFLPTPKSFVSISTLVLAQWAVGAMAVFLLAPFWLQLTHLALADLLWIKFVLMGLPLFVIPKEEKKSTP